MFSALDCLAVERCVCLAFKLDFIETVCQEKENRIYKTTTNQGVGENLNQFSISFTIVLQ